MTKIYACIIFKIKRCNSCISHTKNNCLPTIYGRTGKLPADVEIGVGYKGVTVFKAPGRVLVSQFGIEDLEKWGFKPEINFYFEIRAPGGDGPVFEFATESGPARP